MRMFKLLAFLFLAFFTFAESKDYPVTYHSWDASPTDLSDNSQNAQAPEIAINASGQAIAIWKRFNGSKFVIQASYSTDNGNDWSVAADLSEDSQHAINPVIAMNASGRTIAIWKRFNGSFDIVQTVYSTDGGVTWSSTSNLSATGHGSTEVNIALNDSGQAVAIWVRNQVVQSSYSKDGGVSWSTPSDLTTGERPSSPQVAINSLGQVIAVWVGGAAEYTIRSSTTINEGVAWSSPTNRSNPADYSANPNVVFNASGQAIITWKDDSKEIIHSSYSADNGASWTVEATLSPGGQLCIRPSLSMNASGQAVVTWDNNTNQLVQAIYSTDGGATWLSAAQAIALSVAGTNGSPKIAINDVNRVIAIWNWFDGSHFITKASYSTDGGVSWLSPTSVYTLSAAGGTSTSLRLALNAAGWAIAIWYRNGDGYDRIQVNNDYNISSLEAERQKIRFPLMIDLIDKISWNNMSKVQSYQLYSDSGLTNVLNTYYSGNLFIKHQNKKDSKNYYFTVTDGKEESAAVEILLP